MSIVEDITNARNERDWEKVEVSVQKYRQFLDELSQGNDLLHMTEHFYLTLYEIEANTYNNKSHLNYGRILYALSLLSQYPDDASQADSLTMETVDDIPRFKADGYNYLGDAMFEDKRAVEALVLYKRALEQLALLPESEERSKLAKALVESVAGCYKYLSQDNLLGELPEMFSGYLSKEEVEEIVQQARAPFLKHDPVEDTPEYLEIKEELETILYEHFKGVDQFMGFCFEYWSKKREILLSKYGIEWRSPSSMNPRVHFD